MLINKYLIKFISLNDESKKNILSFARYLPNFLKRFLLNIYLKSKNSELELTKFPTDMFFFVTSYCNMRCEHCFYKDEIDSKSNKDELSFEEIKKFSSSLKGRVRGISLTGGEPFLRKDLAEIVKSFHVDGGVKHVSIATNGFYCDRVMNFFEQTIPNLPSLSIDIQISLDGMEKTHDEVRKIPGSFKKAIVTLSYLERKANQYSNFRVIINTVVHKYNAEEFTDFYSYFTRNHTANFIWHFARKDEIDVNAIKKNKLLVYQDPIQFHNSQSESILPNINDCNNLIDKMITFEGNNALTKWRQQEKKNHLKIAFEGKRAVSRCTAPFKGAVVFGNGDMSICEILKPVDNIRDHEYDFFETWKSEKMSSLRGDASKCYCTYPCYLMDSMLYDKQSISEALEI